MINLIPPAAKKSITREYWMRVGTVWTLLFSVACIVVILLLLPTYILLSIKSSLLADQAQAANDKLSGYNISATELRSANRQSEILLRGPLEPPFSSYQKDISALALSGVDITDWRFSRTSMTGSITLSGLAKTRQDLANFKDKLDTDDRFLSVDLPISNLIKDRDLLFSMTINLATSTPSS